MYVRHIGAITGVKLVQADELDGNYEARDFGWRDSEGDVWAYFDGSWQVHPITAWQSVSAQWVVSDPTVDYGPYTMIEPQLRQVNMTEAERWQVNMTDYEKWLHKDCAHVCGGKYEG